ncbi:hypothetical protein TL16_g11840 [Triparma laevis f. inornata]|uniref:Uncharacterized protein n=1 Tax=Triparma laevis f. inornata TaxID=1714386 RepID=A0A9W7BNX4_9STRA|nr:hypothetical protein TL16_g11840 [Triparma laevis f. inornata]
MGWKQVRHEPPRLNLPRPHSPSPSPDASGWFPGQNTFKDPTRGDINFASMQEERKILDDIIANPKEGNVPGAPGCKN